MRDVRGWRGGGTVGAAVAAVESFPSVSGSTDSGTTDSGTTDSETTDWGMTSSGMTSMDVVSVTLVVPGSWGARVMAPSSVMAPSRVMAPSMAACSSATGTVTMEMSLSLVALSWILNRNEFVSGLPLVLLSTAMTLLNEKVAADETVKEEVVGSLESTREGRLVKMN